MPNTSHSATLPRTTNARTIEEEPEMASKQHSVPSKMEDNRKKEDYNSEITNYQCLTTITVTVVTHPHTLASSVSGG